MYSYVYRYIENVRFAHDSQERLRNFIANQVNTLSEESNNEQPHIARYKPYYFEPEPGRTYFWCSCGRSVKQPFCDGSHKGTSFTPVKYVAPTEPTEVLFCACKHSKDSPFCDGTHNNLRDEYETDDPNSPENRAIPEIGVGNGGRAMLDGGCFVAHVDEMDLQQRGNLAWAPIISSQSGAIYQSQFYFEIEGGASPAIEFADRHVLLFAPHDWGTVNISGRDFSIEPCNGAYVRPGEAFSLTAPPTGKLRVYASVCPLANGPTWPEDTGTNFDKTHSQRIVAIDEDNRTSMADRFFQILVGKDLGCTQATQFIGEIPFSKAAVHRHLYEESLIIVSGKGCMWTQSVRTPVGAGDVIFLPRKQAHSLQCTDADGMVVAGVIYPGDNPGINY